MTKIPKLAPVTNINDRKRKRPSASDFKGYIPPKNGA